jgi:hypothetical protein
MEFEALEYGWHCSCMWDEWSTGIEVRLRTNKSSQSKPPNSLGPWIINESILDGY